MSYSWMRDKGPSKTEKVVGLTTVIIIPYILSVFATFGLTLLFLPAWAWLHHWSHKDEKKLDSESSS